jgi:hypothetical protein
VQPDKQQIEAGFDLVDHMQLMAATGSVRGDYERFTHISRTMKQIAVELALPVLLVSQTSRSNTTDRRAELDVNDPRGSGAIEEDAALHVDLRGFRGSESHQAGRDLRQWSGEDLAQAREMYLPLSHSKKYTRFDVATEEAEHEQPGLAREGKFIAVQVRGSL